MVKKEHNHGTGSAIIRDLILGGQDGLVNVFGVVLAVATATQSRYIILISGLAATFAESISMAAVAYTSGKAAKEYYDRELAREWQEVREKPASEIREIRDIYVKRGFRGTLLNKVVQKITSNKKVWVDTMMREELNLNPEEFAHFIRDSFIVGIAAIIGSFIPILPFFFIPLEYARWTAVAVSTIALFVSGALKGEYIGINPWKSAFEMAIVGMTAALAGYLIGAALGALPIA